MDDVYKRLLDFTKDGVHRYTFSDGTILMANQGFVEILDLGCRPEAIIGKRLSDVLVYAEKQGTVRHLLEKKGELHGFEYHFKTLKGEDKWVLHDSFIVIDPKTGEKIVEAIVKDITYRKKAEQAIEESEEKYRNLVESARDGICIIHERKVAYANAQLGRITGYRVADVIGKSFADYLDPEERARVDEAYEALSRGVEETVPVDTKLVHKDGHRIDVEITASRITYYGRTAAMVVVRDLSERKRLERAIRESGRTEAVVALSGGAAHNFSNLIGLIRGYAVAILDNLIPNSKAHEYAQRILDAADHAAHLGKRLAAVAQPDGGGDVAVLGVVSLDEVLRDTIELVEHSFEQQGIRFEIPEAGGLPCVKADASQLVDVLMNVLLNSAEAMPHGGMVAIDTIERRIVRPRINPKAEGGIYVGLRVHDSGAGLTREVARRVFEPFFTTKSNGKSLGLGLTIAQGTLQAMGGWMDLRGREGMGCTARLFLPKASAPEMTEAAAAPEAAPLSVLLVDDRLDDLAVMRDALAKEGYVVHMAADSKSGVSTYRQNAGRIGLVLVDLLLPKPGSRFVLEEILKIDSQANVIVTSGFSRDYARGSLPMGAWRFLQKPFSPQRLISRVNHVLRGTADSDVE